MIAVTLATLILSPWSGRADEARERRESLGRAAGFLAACPWLRPLPKMSVDLMDLYGNERLALGDAVYESEQRMILARAADMRLKEVCEAAIAEFGPATPMGWLDRSAATVPYPVERLLSLSNTENPLGPHRDIVRVLAGIGFYLNACDRVDMTGKMADYLEAEGVDFKDVTRGPMAGAFFTEILLLRRWHNSDPQRGYDLCGYALRQFGPGGTAKSGLLKSKVAGGG